ncbi:MAG: tRNA (adenosine(37)-N6)-threonylcarbamoyltransferase complex ATPase subunit type 1 TsaE [Bacteroidales bacterium]|jgi:tRNA threonylcarbamoyladenosine biosynthesis protein TsaE|nr:tRNA (adenosine(37)-N6)-threonylcarbamoyltransferase complex ATPase subunit type 1 TsaE [Bacteroidales bacterium]
MSDIIVKGLEELDNAAKEVIKRIGDRKIIAFYGKMGAGKTTLITAICNNLGVIDTISSPSFSLVNEYNTDKGESIFHFDFYRINKIEEAFDFGYEEYFFGGDMCLIEWPELIESILPENIATITITENEDHSRLINVD